MFGYPHVHQYESGAFVGSLGYDDSASSPAFDGIQHAEFAGEGKHVLISSSNNGHVFRCALVEHEWKDSSGVVTVYRDIDARSRQVVTTCAKHPVATLYAADGGIVVASIHYVAATMCWESQIFFVDGCGAVTRTVDIPARVVGLAWLGVGAHVCYKSDDGDVHIIHCVWLASRRAAWIGGLLE